MERWAEMEHGGVCVTVSAQSSLRGRFCLYTVPRLPKGSQRTTGCYLFYSALPHFFY